MKGLTLAVISLGFFVISCGLLLRLYRGDKEYKVFLGSFGSALIVYAVLFAALPRDLGLLPASVVEPAAAVDFLNGILVLSMIFHGIWTLSYIVWTGPTMRLLNEMSRSRGQGISVREAVLQFGGGEGDNILLRRRLPKLITGGYITEEDRVYRLLPRGRSAARMLLRVRRAIGDANEE
jgi:hypothetical protein